MTRTKMIDKKTKTEIEVIVEQTGLNVEPENGVAGNQPIDFDVEIVKKRQRERELDRKRYISSITMKTQGEARKDRKKKRRNKMAKKSRKANR